MLLDSEKITGIILAGGKSSRMGSEKGLIKIQDKTFISYIIDAVKPMVKEILIVSNSDAYDYLGYKCVKDIVKHAGPLAGLHSGLFHSETEKNLVLSCDVPFITKEVLKLLIEHSFSEEDIVQCQSNGRIMPLIAMYKKKCKDTCIQLLNNGERRLMQVSKHLKTKTIVLDPSLEKYVQNINTKEQLKMIHNGYSS